MKASLAVMIGDGHKYQEHGIGDVLHTGERIDYANVRCWTVHCEVIASVFRDDDGFQVIRLTCAPDDSDTACNEQPHVHLYMDAEQWEDLSYMVTRHIEREGRDRAQG